MRTLIPSAAARRRHRTSSHTSSGQDRAQARGLMHRAVLTAGAAAVLLGPALWAASPAGADTNPACPDAFSSTATSCIYHYTGAEQDFTVPDRVTAVTITTVGAPGGKVYGNDAGVGAVVTATVPLPAGTTTLYAEVGGPGFNGGGGGGGQGGAGGGASDVRTTSITQISDSQLTTATDTRLVVAGGGGGAGESVGDSARGGDAGFFLATGAGNGGDGDDHSGQPAGYGGTQGGAGGAGTDYGGAGGSGSLGQGGSGASNLGGGGGGGYYGGGGGGEVPGLNGSGGGGGSSFSVAGQANTTMDFGSNDTPSVVISWTPPAADTITTVPPSASPSVVGQAVTYTATVSPAPDGGTVAFTDGTTPVTGCGTQPVDNTGTATCQVTYNTVGSHSITAAYSGDAAFKASTSAAMTQTVGQADTTTKVTSAANPSTAGQDVTFTATVSAKAPGAGTPTGQITFSDGGTTLGTATLDASGAATLDTSALPAGGHSITASYGGDDNFTTSSGTLTQTVNKITTSTKVTSPANPSIAGAPVTYTATISPAPDGGTVAFTDGTTPVTGCGAQPVTSTGTATCQVTYTSPGSHPITAAYSGDATYAASTSAALTQQAAYQVQLQYDPAKASNSGTTVPVKIQLRNAAGTNLSAPGIKVTVTGLSPSPAPGKAPAGTFTFLTLDQGPGYQLNIKTTGYPAGTYTLSFTAGSDPTVHTAKFIIS